MSRINNEVDLQNEILRILKQIENQNTTSSSPTSNVVVTNTPLPVSLTSGNVSITGPITVSNEVEIKNDIGNPIPINGIIELGSVSLAALENTNVTVLNGIGSNAVNIQDGGNSITVDGSVSVSNFPVNQVVSGTIIANAGTGFQTNALTNIELRATPVPVSGIVTANIGLTNGLALEHITATSPNSTRLSDGVNFYDARNIRPLVASDVVTISNSSFTTTNNDNRYEHFLAVSKEETEPCIIRYTYDINGNRIAEDVLDTNYNITGVSTNIVSSHNEAVLMKLINISNSNNGNSLINRDDFIEFNPSDTTFKSGFILCEIQGNNTETVLPNIYSNNNLNSYIQTLKYEMTSYYDRITDKTYCTFSFNCLDSYYIRMVLNDNTQLVGFG